MSMRDISAKTPGGTLGYAQAKLRRNVADLLHATLNASEFSQSGLARSLRKSRSAVNQVLTRDRNLRLDTVAEYLDSMGYELVVTVRKVEGKQGLSKSRETSLSSSST
jgi:hypothetical protein